MVVFYAVATDSGGLLTVLEWIFCGWEKFTLRFKEKSKDDARVGDDGGAPKTSFRRKSAKRKNDCIFIFFFLRILLLERVEE